MKISGNSSDFHKNILLITFAEYIYPQYLILNNMIQIGLSEGEIKQSVNLLQSLLANHFTLLLKTWQFHWNVVGDSFGSYHEAMLKLYEEEIERVDDVAERIRALGERPLGSMEAMLQHNSIKEFSMKQAVPQALEMWAEIRDDWDRLIKEIREIHEVVPPKDFATLNFLEDMIESMEKEAWMNRSYNVTSTGI